MKCPNCGYTDSKVVDSRPTGDSSIRRRRECLKCKYRFTTYEFIEVGPNFVIKKNGTKEIFDRNKILTGLIKACYKRPVTNEQLENIVNDIESAIGNSMKHEIKSSDIGEVVMEMLKEISKDELIEENRNNNNDNNIRNCSDILNNFRNTVNTFETKFDYEKPIMNNTNNNIKVNKESNKNEITNLFDDIPNFFEFIS